MPPRGHRRRVWRWPLGSADQLLELRSLNVGGGGVPGVNLVTHFFPRPSDEFRAALWLVTLWTIAWGAPGLLYMFLCAIGH